MRRASLNSLPALLVGYKYIEELCQVIECIIREVHPLALILFGSLAKGDHHEKSDADLCVILDCEAIHPLARPLPIEPCNPEGIAEAQAFGKAEFKNMLKDANGLALEIMHYGLLLAGDESFAAELEKLFEEVKEEWGLEKTPTGWIAHRYAEIVKKALPG